MDLKKAKTSIDSIIEKNSKKLQKTVQALLKEHGEDVDLIAFEIFSDHFEIHAHIVKKDEGPSQEPLFGEDSPYEILATTLETVVTDEDPKKQKAINDFIKDTELALMESLAEAWKSSLKKGAKIRAYAWVEDDADALDLNSGKKIKTEKFEKELFAAPKERKLIAIEALSEKELAGLPKFFDGTLKDWSNEKVLAEVDKYFEFCKQEFERVAQPLTAAFKKYQKENKSPDGALFIDLRMEPHPQGLRVFLWGVTNKYKEASSLPPEGTEIDLGTPNPLARWIHVMFGMSERLSTQREFSTLREIDGLQCEWALKRYIRNAWVDAGGPSWGPAVFIRHTFSNRWTDLEDPEKDLNLETVKKLAAKK